MQCISSNMVLGQWVGHLGLQSVKIIYFSIVLWSKQDILWLSVLHSACDNTLQSWYSLARNQSVKRNRLLNSNLNSEDSEVDVNVMQCSYSVSVHSSLCQIEVRKKLVSGIPYDKDYSMYNVIIDLVCVKLPYTVVFVPRIIYKKY